MHRKKAADFPQELLDLLDGYVHGGISRRNFGRSTKICGRRLKYRGAVPDAKAELCDGLYSIQPDYKRIKAEWATVPSPEGNGSIKDYLVRPANAARPPPVLVVHENRGLNPYIEDVARRLAVADSSHWHLTH